MTTESQFVAEQLALLLTPGSHYRVGALLLTYDCGDADGCRIAHGVAMQVPAVPTAAGAVDLVQMIKCLRYLADKLDKKLRGGP